MRKHHIGFCRAGGEKTGMKLLSFFAGSRCVHASAVASTALLDICLQNSIGYRDFICHEDGSVSFRASYATVKHLEKLCRMQGIPISVDGNKGLPHLLYLHRKRAGIMVGTLAAIALVALSGRFVWDIRITGNTTVSEREILGELRECGLTVGSYIPDLHTGELENRVLIASDKLSWVSIYLDGTVARVQVIEHTAPPASEDTAKPANLIAAFDGQIETVELLRGNCVVTPGQAVRKGELLVSGLYDSQIVGYRWTRAAGKVMARTEHTLRIEIPMCYEQKVYSDAKVSEIVLNFFDFSMKIFKSTGNPPPTCDIIKEEKGIFGSWGHDLPFGLCISRLHPYTVQTRSRTPEEALDAAYARLSHELGALTDQKEILQKQIVTTLDEDTLILECTLLCLEDIAVQYEFEIAE